jgi:hypothetical protein
MFYLTYGTNKVLRIMEIHVTPPPTLQDRRTNAKLVFLYKVDEGLVPAIDPDTFIKLNRPKRQIRSVKFTDCVAQNIIESIF